LNVIDKGWGGKKDPDLAGIGSFPNLSHKDIVNPETEDYPRIGSSVDPAGQESFPQRLAGEIFSPYRRQTTPILQSAIGTGLL